MGFSIFGPCSSFDSCRTHANLWPIFFMIQEADPMDLLPLPERTACTQRLRDLHLQWIGETGNYFDLIKEIQTVAPKTVQLLNVKADAWADAMFKYRQGKGEWQKFQDLIQDWTMQVIFKLEELKCQ